jgi:hypothetical protein
MRCGYLGSRGGGFDFWEGDANISGNLKITANGCCCGFFHISPTAARLARYDDSRLIRAGAGTWQIGISTFGHRAHWRNASARLSMGVILIVREGTGKDKGK